MIVRILGEGQCDVSDDAMADLNSLDNRLQAALDSDDDAAFRSALEALLTRVRQVGTPVPDEALLPSDLVLPRADAHVDEVREMLTDEGLIPG